jgi:hypothetical protein
VWGYQCVGSLVGCNFSEGRIVGCRAACSRVCAYKHGAGGLVGVNSGSIVGSYALGGILGSDSSFSLAGVNEGTITVRQAGIHTIGDDEVVGWALAHADDLGMVGQQQHGLKPILPDWPEL